MSLTIVELSVFEFGNGDEVRLRLTLVEFGDFYLLLVLENLVHIVTLVLELLKLAGDFLLLRKGNLVCPLGKDYCRFIDIACRLCELAGVTCNGVGRYFLDIHIC